MLLDVGKVLGSFFCCLLGFSDGCLDGAGLLYSVLGFSRIGISSKR